MNQSLDIIQGAALTILVFMCIFLNGFKVKVSKYVQSLNGTPVTSCTYKEVESARRKPVLFAKLNHLLGI